MVRIAGGTFVMGSENFYPEEAPTHRVEVGDIWMDRHLVTNRDFRRFVDQTGYLTVAERPLDPSQYPDADPSLLVPGSLVFQKTRGPVPLEDYRAWWAYVPGANWRHPQGPDSDTSGRDRFPVVHIANEDAVAYSEWCGKSIPTEAEWEHAARGGLEGADFTWGDEDHYGSRRLMANTWQGRFPWENHKAGGYEGTSRVGAFPANGYGLYDMAGNTWEWTTDFYTPRHPEDAASACCVPRNPRVESSGQSHQLGQPGEHIPRKVIKGGSHLCAPNYCLRYRPAARQGESLDSSTGHLGFRCIVRPQPAD